MLPPVSTRRNNLPQRRPRPISTNQFPGDLLSDGRTLATQIEFVEYLSQVPGLLNPTGTIANPGGGMYLPIPKKINEVQTLTWSEISLTSMAGSAVSSRLSTNANQIGQSLLAAGSVFTGLQVNPYLFMAFQRPNFKEYSFSWTLAPNNPQESQTLQTIISEFKDKSLPAFYGPIMVYPNIALIKFLPNNIFGNLIFKPCAVTSVIVDYTGAGPSFFKGTQAPTVVNLTVNFKEIQLWGRGETSASGLVSGGSYDSISGALLQGSSEGTVGATNNQIGVF